MKGSLNFPLFEIQNQVEYKDRYLVESLFPLTHQNTQIN